MLLFVLVKSVTAAACLGKVCHSCCLSWYSLSQLCLGTVCHSFVLVQSVTALSWYSLSQLCLGTVCHSCCLSWYSLSQLCLGTVCHSFVLVQSVTALSWYSLSQLLLVLVQSVTAAACLGTVCHSFVLVQSVTALSWYSLSQLQLALVQSVTAAACHGTVCQLGDGASQCTRRALVYVEHSTAANALTSKIEVLLSVSEMFLTKIRVELSIVIRPKTSQSWGTPHLSWNDEVSCD